MEGVGVRQSGMDLDSVTTYHLCDLGKVTAAETSACSAENGEAEARVLEDPFLKYTCRPLSLTFPPASCAKADCGFPESDLQTLAASPTVPLRELVPRCLQLPWPSSPALVTPLPQGLKFSAGERCTRIQGLLVLDAVPHLVGPGAARCPQAPPPVQMRVCDVHRTCPSLLTLPLAHPRHCRPPLSFRACGCVAASSPGGASSQPPLNSSWA